jgi:hypothetical protein
MGLADRSDAIVVVVSEERGEVTLMCEGRAERMKDPSMLQTALRALVSHENAQSPRKRAVRLPKLGLQTAALGLAALVWTATFLFPGRSVREHTVPVEFTNVPAGMTIAAQSTGIVQVWLRGTDFLFESVNLDALIARCDLSTAHEGNNTIHLQVTAFDVPFGLKIEDIAPRQVNVRLAGTPASDAERQ